MISLIVAVGLMLLLFPAGCSLQQDRIEKIGDRGHFELRDPAPETSAMREAMLSSWSNDVSLLRRETPEPPMQMAVQLMKLGRIHVIPSRSGVTGVVIGAPHGSYDAFTDEVATSVARRTGWAAVIAQGFTPTETGDSKRINVNRPTERYVFLSYPELETDRARRVYEQYAASVLRAARGALELYIDIHQNNGAHIEVATVGISKEEATRIKEAYRAARRLALQDRPNIRTVDLRIEPLDDLEVGAWPAKRNGILRLARRSLHFELPNDVLSFSQQRRTYTTLLGDLLADLPTLLHRRAR